MSEDASRTPSHGNDSTLTVCAESTGAVSKVDMAAIEHMFSARQDGKEVGINSLTAEELKHEFKQSLHSGDLTTAIRLTSAAASSAHCSATALHPVAASPTSVPAKQLETAQKINVSSKRMSNHQEGRGGGKKEQSI